LNKNRISRLCEHKKKMGRTLPMESNFPECLVGKQVYICGGRGTGKTTCLMNLVQKAMDDPIHNFDFFYFGCQFFPENLKSRAMDLSCHDYDSLSTLLRSRTTLRGMFIFCDDVHMSSRLHLMLNTEITFFLTLPYCKFSDHVCPLRLYNETWLNSVWPDSAPPLVTIGNGQYTWKAYTYDMLPSSCL